MRRDNILVTSVMENKLLEFCSPAALLAVGSFCTLMKKRGAEMGLHHHAVMYENKPSSII